jgi:RsmE family RNA methyltransferase
MNLILIEPEEIEGDRVRLSDRRAVHLREVIRPAVGDSLRVGVVRGPRGRAVVASLGSPHVELRLTLAEASTAPAPPPVELVLAVRRVLRVVGAMGVSHLELVNAWRVQKSYFQSPVLAPAAVEAALRQGAEQGATTWVPRWDLHRRLMGYLDEVLPRRPRVDVQLLSHPCAGRPLEQVARPGAGAAGTVRAAVGPEGGWIQREVDTFARRGFTPAHLGEPVLGVEPAVAVLLGQLALLRRLGGPMLETNELVPGADDNDTATGAAPNNQ